MSNPFANDQDWDRERLSPRGSRLEDHGSWESELKHSGLGITSLLIALLMGPFEFLMIVIAGVMAASNKGLDEKSPAAIILGLLILGGMAGCVIGGVLGLAGVLQADRKKLFSILGIGLNATILFGMVAIMVIGSML